MKDELRKLPLRFVPNDYADRVMKHIAQAEARGTNAWIGAQIAVTGLIALLIAWAQSAEIVSVIESVLENSNAAMLALEQFIGDLASAFNNIRIEPVESIAPLEWLMIAIAAGIVWLLASGLLIVDSRKEKMI